MRPCLTCGTPSKTSYCPAHGRTSNLARDLLTQIAERDRWTCQHCHKPVTHRGHDSQAASIDHHDGNPANNHPTNLRLTHIGCNASLTHAGWI